MTDTQENLAFTSDDKPMIEQRVVNERQHAPPASAHAQLLQSSALLGDPFEGLAFPDVWCTISYFEFDQSVGETFKVRVQFKSGCRLEEFPVILSDRSLKRFSLYCSTLVLVDCVRPEGKRYTSCTFPLCGTAGGCARAGGNGGRLHGPVVVESLLSRAAVQCALERGVGARAQPHRTRPRARARAALLGARALPLGSRRHARRRLAALSLGARALPPEVSPSLPDPTARSRTPH